MDFKGKKVAVLGWGINGLDVVKFLLEQESKVTIFDAKEKQDLDFSTIDINNVDLALGKNYLNNGFNNFDIIFRTPGVYRYLPQLLEAEKNNVKVTSAIQTFFDLCPGKIIGVTGTKGKGTTSTLIYEILKEDEKDVYLAGNIGYPVLDLLPKLMSDSWVVLELSSFQLIDLQKSPNISVVLNITSDHLDWHKDQNEYVRAKQNILKHQTTNDFAVINTDYDVSKSFEKFGNAKKYYFSKKAEVEGCFVKEGKIILSFNDVEESLGETNKLLLRGEHNLENITAASLAASLAGASNKSIIKSIYSFKGLEHRLELIKSVGGVTFYNDSFSTNPQTTIAAIRSFKESITLILGGSDKGLNYEDMGREISEAKNVNNVILIGDISDIIKESLVKAHFSGNTVELYKSSIGNIVKKCLEVTPKGGVVLLSPATASFDMFDNYKDRGNKFKEAVNELQ